MIEGDSNKKLFINHQRKRTVKDQRKIWIGEKSINSYITVSEKRLKAFVLLEFKNFLFNKTTDKNQIYQSIYITIQVF